jgi:hypothetical protein
MSTAAQKHERVRVEQTNSFDGYEYRLMAGAQVLFYWRLS